MSSASDSNWSPQPPNLQQLEKKEAAAMPVMSAALVHSPGEQEEEEAAAMVEVEEKEEGADRGARPGGGGEGGGVSGSEGAAGLEDRGGSSRHRPRRPDRTAADAAGRRAGETVWVGVRMGGGLVVATSPAVYLFGRMIGGCHSRLKLLYFFFLLLLFCTNTAVLTKSDAIF